MLDDLVIDAAATSLVVMAKAPQLGRVKARLAAGIGAERALHVYRALLAITAAAARAWPGPVLLAWTGDESAFAGSAFEPVERVPQPDGELGPRIAAALRAGRARAPAALVIGSDCPGVGAATLRAVAALLAGAPVAFGPADDGGFWAIAARDDRAAAVLDVAHVPWSAADTLAVLRERLDAAGLPSRLGPELFDCDTEADLQRAIAAGLLTARQPSARE